MYAIIAILITAAWIPCNKLAAIYDIMIRMAEIVLSSAIPFLLSFGGRDIFKKLWYYGVYKKLWTVIFAVNFNELSVIKTLLVFYEGQPFEPNGKRISWLEYAPSDNSLHISILLSLVYSGYLVEITNSTCESFGLHTMPKNSRVFILTDKMLNIIDHNSKWELGINYSHTLLI